MADKLAVKASGSAFIENLKIFSNDESAQTQEIDLVSKGAPVRLTYYESLLQDTIVATLVYIDTGNTVDDKTAVEGLPITGSESATLKFTDNNNEIAYLSFGGAVQLSYNDSELEGHGIAYHSEGYGAAVGILSKINLPLHQLDNNQLESLGIKENSKILLNFISGLVVSGTVKKVLMIDS